MKGLKMVRAIFSSNRLTFLKRRAMQKGVWFKVLDHEERAIVDLTIRTVRTIRSSILKEVLMTISEKLMKAMESQVARLTETIGRSLTQKIASLAFSWGNRKALKWSKDSSFIRYLTITELNATRTHA